MPAFLAEQPSAKGSKRAKPYTPKNVGEVYRQNQPTNRKPQTQTRNRAKQLRPLRGAGRPHDAQVGWARHLDDDRYLGIEGILWRFMVLINRITTVITYNPIITILGHLRGLSGGHKCSYNWIIPEPPRRASRA